MLHDAVSARHLGDYRIEVTFDDGAVGVVDFATYAQKGGVFRKFRDPAFFRDFKVNTELGVLEWGNGEVDIAPEALYAEATGTPLPDWAEANSDGVNPSPAASAARG